MTEERRPRLFYGYVIVFGAWLAMFVSAGAQYSFAIFQPVLLDEFGWTRGMISLGLTLSLLFMPLFSVVGAHLVDRIGPRWTVIIGAAIGALGIGLLSTITEVWHFILFYGVLAPIGLALSYMIATVSTVRRWFMRRAALMVAIAMSGSGLGIVFLVPAAQVMIQAWGFRVSYIAFGLILLVGGVAGGLLLRKDPESTGTYPDGVKPTEEELRTRDDFMAREERWSLREVFRTRSCWLFICAQLGTTVAVIGLLGHLLIWGEDLGVARDTMTIIYGFVFVLAAVVGRLLGGFISDWYMSRFKVSRKPILYFNILGVGLGVFLCPLVGNVTGVVLVSALLGLAYGSGLAVFPTYQGDLFGVVNLPMLFGVFGLFIAGFGSVGPILFGFCFDLTGSYDAAFIITGVLCLVSATCLFLLKPPRRKQHKTPAA
ncbi:MAG: MFS transporter [Chloroflexota bacterium]|nr:MFS transporter [Chloroflexota bacterium]